jgi:putative DNA methylase
VHVFGRQGLPMVWDFAELNPFAGAAGDLSVSLNGMTKIIAQLITEFPGEAINFDAQKQSISSNCCISTDPPYYDNIGYADLSDYFYVWLRRSLKGIFPALFSTMAVPKDEELVATPSRHGGKKSAELFFLDGMTDAMNRLAQQAHPGFPVTIYYAFKQSASDGDEGITNTGWDTFLEAVIKAGFAITGTWPIRTERIGRMVGNGKNALASSIVLVCRKRDLSAPTATRREFISELKIELPKALLHLQEGNIAPVDLAQAAIGPGMGVYTKFQKVVNAEGDTISVKSALVLINQILDESLTEQEGDFDSDSRFALAWFDQYGFDEGEFGVADVLARAKATSVDGISAAGIISAGKGKVRLLKPNDSENVEDNLN